jgi:hypothetical protein
MRPAATAAEAAVPPGERRSLHGPSGPEFDTFAT